MHHKMYVRCLQLTPSGVPIAMACCLWNHQMMVIVILLWDTLIDNYKTRKIRTFINPTNGSFVFAWSLFSTEVDGGTATEAMEGVAKKCWRSPSANNSGCEAGRRGWCEAMCKVGVMLAGHEIGKTQFVQLGHEEAPCRLLERCLTSINLQSFWRCLNLRQSPVVRHGRRTEGLSHKLGGWKRSDGYGTPS